MSDINVIVPGTPPIHVNLSPGYIGQSGYSGYSGYSGATGGLSYVRAFTYADLVGGILTVNHSFGQQWCYVQVVDNDNKRIFPDDITLVDENTCTVDISSYRVIPEIGRAHV